MNSKNPNISSFNSYKNSSDYEGMNLGQFYYIPYINFDDTIWNLGQFIKLI